MTEALAVDSPVFKFFKPSIVLICLDFFPLCIFRAEIGSTIYF